MLIERRLRRRQLWCQWNYLLGDVWTRSNFLSKITYLYVFIARQVVHGETFVTNIAEVYIGWVAHVLLRVSPDESIGVCEL